MQTPEAVMQMRLMPRFYALQREAAGILDPGALKQISEEIEPLIARIDNAREPEEGLTRAMDTLGARIDALASLDAMEQRLQASNLPLVQKGLGPKIQEARAALLAGDLERARQLREQIIASLEETGQSMGGEVQVDRIQEPLLAAWTRLAQLRAERPVQTLIRLSPPRRMVARLLATLAGTHGPDVRVRFWLIQPLLFLTLLVVLALLGLQLLYINAGATFGSNGIYDYLGLFLWGASIDVAQGTLQNAKGLGGGIAR